jgi:hypothetical protein
MRYAAVEIDRIDHLVFTVADIDAPPPYSSPLNTLRLDHHEENACSTPLDGTRPGGDMQDEAQDRPYRVWLGHH